MTNSERFYWCKGCGKWHDRLVERNGFHFSMCWPWEEPNERNFEGTPEDLRRFNIARKIRQEDNEDFERRIDARFEK